jgi:uncharacterized protein (TIGR00369 family)
MTDADGAMPAEAATLVEEYIERHHDFLAWLDTRVDSIERERVVLTVPYDEKLTNRTPGWREENDVPAGMHGGVAATLIDTAGGIAQRTAFDDPLTGGVATVNLNVNYLRRAGGDLTATADVVRAGDSIGVSTVTVETPTASGTEAVATGQAAYRLFR